MYNEIDSNKRKSILLITIFIVLVILLGWLFGQITNSGYAGLVIAIIISVIMALFSYYKGDKVALWTAGAQSIEKKDNAYVYRLVENLCLTAGLPLPRVYIIPDPAINAFATGRDPNHASIAITAGAIEKLENEELEGVIAHELSHVQNYDIRFMTIVIVLIGIIALLSDWLMRSFLFRRRRNDNNSGQLGIILLVAGIILAILAPLIGKLIQLAISRKREFLADASGALLTRYPEGLARALEKIEVYNKEPMQKANDATAHLYISSPFGENKQKFFHKLFSTHPPIEERINILRKMT
jgi:heat shock protein HtpX